jgi:hypothetical protein
MQTGMAALLHDTSNDEKGHLYERLLCVKNRETEKGLYK